MAIVKSNLVALCLGVVVACGCGESTPGGPGVQTNPNSQTQTANKPVISESKETFTLTTPVLSTSLKQGEKKVVSIGIRRGTNFDEDVQISFTNAPTGVTLDPANPTIKRGEEESKINISAGDDAAIGDFTMNVKGHPLAGGADATSKLNLTITAR